MVDASDGGGASASSTARGAVHSTLRRAQHLEDEARALLRGHYPSSAPTQLLKFVVSTAQQVRSELAELSSAQAAEAVLKPSEFDQIVVRYGHRLMMLHGLMSYVDRSQTEEIPAELVVPLSRLMSSLVPQSGLILQSSWEVNYSVTDVGRFIEKFLGPDYPKFLETAQTRPFLIRFPKAEFGNVLLHCIVAHELGHQVYRQVKLADALLPKIRLDRPPLSCMIDDLVEDAVRALAQELTPAKEDEPTQLTLADFLTRERVRASINVQLNKTLAAWVEELTCDALATQILGVSYLFAFAEFAASLLGVDQASERHPPPRLRIALMSSMLQGHLLKAKEEGDSLVRGSRYLAALEEHFNQWKSLVAASEPNAATRLLAIPLRAAESLLGEISSATQTLILPSSNRFYDPRIDLACRQLQLLITCNEIFTDDGTEGSLADVDLLLRTAWAFTLAEFPDWQERYGFDPARCGDKLSELILKSLELIEVVNTVRGA